jgi:thiosulfate/3-mercaptopyruvate sulfurtransferase
VINADMNTNQRSSSSSALVEAAWVAAHVGDPDVRLVEVDWDGTKAYEQGHIPGALGWHWKTMLWDPLRREFPDPETMAARLGAAGIGNDTTVVVYGEPLQFGTYGWWVLRYCGHRDVRLLDGGRTRWTREGRPLTTEVPAVARKRYTPTNPDPSMRILRDEVLPLLGDPGTVLFDVRSPEEYRGERVAPPGRADDGAERAGRIPGAVHLHFLDLLRDDGTFKAPEEMLRLCEARGVTPDKQVIVYCRLSHRASLACFALTELLRYPRVRTYDGSWTEWGSVVGVPIER